MVSASSILAAMAIAASSPASTDAFTTSSARNSHTQLHAAATDDASARALSDYMAKSHEEKLKAVGAVEEKKNAEIADLKAEIELLKSSSSSLAVAAPPAAPAPAAPVLAASELESKLASYQNFMTEYIVNAQNQKLLAVKEAELKAEKKFQERLDRLFEAGGMAPPGAAAAEVVVAAAPVELTSYQSRNAYVAAAGAAGKSRWGEKEVAKASAEAAAQPVAAASDGAAVSATSFESRNAQVAAAGAAGKSRWGDLEVAKASNGASAPAAAAAAAVEEEPAAPAGPVSLEDRVNLGALMLAR